MGSGSRLRSWAAAAVVAASPAFGHAQGFTADYDLAPVRSLGGLSPGAGLSLQAGRNWFGQVQLAQDPAGTLPFLATHDSVSIAGGYRWHNGQSLSLQLRRGRGPGERLGLALNYDWPRYFVRLSYDPGWTLAPQDSLRFSAGVRF